MNIQIRELRSDDLSEALAIESQSFVAPRWKEGAFLAYDTWVAEVDGKVAGFLVSRPIVEGEREILNLAVTPGLRRCGVAKALIRHEMTHGQTLFLEVRESNTGAQELYRAMGFVEIGRRPKYYQVPEESAIVMKMN